MPYYCFNENCNRWGEAQSIAMYLLWPEQGKLGKCKECGKPLIRHDNWNEDCRIGDDGKAVVV